jgi:hypothetical protein
MAWLDAFARTASRSARWVTLSRSTCMQARGIARISRTAMDQEVAMLPGVAPGTGEAVLTTIT